jgi:hypothetical protein
MGAQLLGAEAGKTQFLDLLDALLNRKVHPVNGRLLALGLGKLQQRLAGIILGLGPTLGGRADLWAATGGARGIRLWA